MGAWWALCNVPCKSNFGTTSHTIIIGHHIAHQSGIPEHPKMANYYAMVSHTHVVTYWDMLFKLIQSCKLMGAIAMLFKLIQSCKLMGAIATTYSREHEQLRSAT